jgi:predicted Fe-S protein YdhL (DUF1289 family)
MITPCVAICVVDKITQICKGCGRTCEEISNWNSFSEEEKMKVMQRLGYAQKRMGRQERLRRYDRG